jgi:uncharacterized membrane protein
VKIESNSRSLVKAVSYRILGSCATALLFFLFTGRAGSALAIGGADVVVKILIYYIHERIWDRISLGRVKAPEYEI